MTMGERMDDGDFALLLDSIAHRLIEARRLSRGDVIGCLAVTISTLISEIPQGAERRRVLAQMTAALSEDVEDLVAERRQ